MGGVEGIAVMVDDATMPEEIYKVPIYIQWFVLKYFLIYLRKRLVWS